MAYDKPFLMPEWELATRNDVDIVSFSHTEKDADGEDADWYLVKYKDGEEKPVATSGSKPAKPIWPWLAGGGALLLIILSIFLFRKK